MIIDWEVARIFIAAVILIIIGLVIILATKKDHLHGGGGGGHGGGGGGWHGGGGRGFGGRRFRRGGGSGAGGWGWWWPWYDYPDSAGYFPGDINVINLPSSSKIGYGIDDSGKTVDIVFGGYNSDGDSMYVFTKDGSSVGSEKRKIPLKNKDKIPLTIGGTTSVFTAYLGK